MTDRPQLDDIPGWFFASDRALFRWFLEDQRASGLRGNLVEMGAYMGKSAVVMGDYLRDDETFTVIDLFESEAPDDENALENANSYSTLTRGRFEANYASFHDRAPEVFTAPSSQIVDHVAAGSCRYIHVDASHLYEHVAIDVESAKGLLEPAGIVVFDDYRTEHTPGVSAAVWEAVINKGLNPIIVSESKLYGTWGDAAGYRDRLWAWLEENPLGWGEFQEIAGHKMIRGKVRAAPAPAAVAAPTPPKPQPKPRPKPQAQPKPQRKRKPAPPPPTGWRKVVHDWAPPRALAGAKALRRKLR